MITTVNRTNTVSTQVDRAIDFAPVGEDIIAFRVTSKTTRTTQRGNGKPKKKTTTKVEEGFTSKKGLQSFLDGKVDQMPEAHETRGLRMVNDAYLEVLRYRGWLSLPDDPDRAHLFKGMAEVNTPLTHLEQGMPLTNIIQIEGSTQMVFDIEDQPLPVAILINGVGNGFMIEDYNRQKVREILEARDDVTTHKLPGVGDRVLWVWNPSPEAMRALWDQCCSYEGGRYPSTLKHRAIFDLDLLGLRAGGAAKYDSYYGRYEQVNRDEDDDNYEVGIDF